jgi:hypothetical protein
MLVRQHVWIILIGMVLVFMGFIPSQAAPLNQKMQHLSRLLNLDVMLEDSIAADDAVPLPADAQKLSQDELLRRSLRGYSYAVLYDSRGAARLWVYKSGTGKYTRIAAPRISANHAATTQSSVTRTSRQKDTQTSARGTPVRTFIMPASFDPNVKQSIHGYQYKTNSFGYHEPVASGDLLAALPSHYDQGSLNAGSSPSISSSSDYRRYRQMAREFEEQQHMATSAMMQHFRAGRK